jgi:hypothetical protein
MSTATSFKYHRAFPFCPAPFSSSGNHFFEDTMSNTLTVPDDFWLVDMPLADAMALFWNLERARLTMSDGMTSYEMDSDADDVSPSLLPAFDADGDPVPGTILVTSYGSTVRILTGSAGGNYSDERLTPKDPRDRVCWVSAVTYPGVDFQYNTTGSVWRSGGVRFAFYAHATDESLVRVGLLGSALEKWVIGSADDVGASAFTYESGLTISATDMDDLPNELTVSGVVNGNTYHFPYLSFGVFVDPIDSDGLTLSGLTLDFHTYA